MGSLPMNEVFMQFVLPLCGGAAGAFINGFFVKRWILSTDERLNDVVEKLTAMQCVDASYQVELKNIKKDVGVAKEWSQNALNTTIRLDTLCRATHSRGGN
jgi:hypothetical protein